MDGYFVAQTASIFLNPRWQETIDGAWLTVSTVSYNYPKVPVHHVLIFIYK